VIAEAIRALDLDPAGKLSDRARAVLRKIAETHNADEIPSLRTVRAFLAGQAVGGNSGRKSGRKSRRVA